MEANTHSKRFTIGTAYLSDEGICTLELGSDSQHELNEETAEEMIQAIYEVCEGQPKPLLTNVSKARGTVGPGAREFIRNHEKMLQVRKAEAFVVGNAAHRIIASFYINFNKPPNPTKVFSDVENARKWLLQFV